MAKLLSAGRQTRAVLACLMLSACIIAPDGDWAPYSREAPARLAVVMPADAPSISQQFNALGHLGLDVWAPVGTQAIAPLDGQVVASTTDPLYGNVLVIDHGFDETGAQVQTVYKHLSARLVAVGDRVARGQPIGAVGRTGALAAGISHLHFEYRRGRPGRALDPIDPNLMWVGGAGRVTCFDPAADYPASPLRLTYPVACGG
jgi:murein DD-endopeptidase MepM/ murein hydrolase activator NlpD